MPEREAVGAGWWPDALDRRVLVGAAAASVVLFVATGTGHLVVVAVLVGVACWDRWAGVVGVLVALAVSLRFGTASLDHLVGAQGVLGPAGTVGPASAAASAWAATAALVLAARRSGVGRWVRWLPVLACGALAATVVCGPRGEPALRLGATAAVVVVAVGAALLDRWPSLVPVRRVLAVVAAAAAVVLAGWPVT